MSNISIGIGAVTLVAPVGLRFGLRGCFPILMSTISLPRFVSISLTSCCSLLKTLTRPWSSHIDGEGWSIFCRATLSFVLVVWRIKFEFFYLPIIFGWGAACNFTVGLPYEGALLGLVASFVLGPSDFLLTIGYLGRATITLLLLAYFGDSIIFS